MRAASLTAAFSRLSSSRADPLGYSAKVLQVMSGFTNVTIDDADPQVEYPPFQPWRQIQTSNPKVKNGTLTELSVPGFLQFSFTGAHATVSSQGSVSVERHRYLSGTELWVYGTVMPTVQAKDKARIVAQFALGGPSGVADTITTFTSPALSQEGDGVLFWASGPLDLGYYQLLVNVTSASTDSPFAIDYLVYTKQQPLSSQPEDPFSVTESPPATSPVSVALSLTPLPSSASSTPSSTSILSSEPSVGSMSSPNSTPQTVDSSPNTSTSHSRHVGAIVGGVLGGVAFLAVVLICFLYWRRLRSRQSNLGSQGEDIACI